MLRERSSSSAPWTLASVPWLRRAAEYWENVYDLTYAGTENVKGAKEAPVCLG